VFIGFQAFWKVPRQGQLIRDAGRKNGSINICANRIIQRVPTARAGVEKDK
jgi:hypothetical protein